MHTYIIMSVAILLLLVLITVAIIAKHKNQPLKPDYYALFIMGLLWLPLGIPLDNYGLSGMGLIFLIAGLVNRDKWKENRKTWRALTDREKKLKIALVVVLGLMVLAGLALYLVNARTAIS